MTCWSSSRTTSSSSLTSTASFPIQAILTAIGLDGIAGLSRNPLGNCGVPSDGFGTIPIEYSWTPNVLSHSPCPSLLPPALCFTE